MEYTNHAVDGSPIGEASWSPSLMTTSDICGAVRSHNRSFLHPTLKVNSLLPLQQTQPPQLPLPPRQPQPQPQPQQIIPAPSSSSLLPNCSQSQMTQPPSADESATSGGTSPPLGDDHHALSRSLHHLTPNQDSIMSDYWHPPPFLPGPLPDTDPDTDVNHSERGIAGFVSKLYQYGWPAPDILLLLSNACRFFRIFFHVLGAYRPLTMAKNTRVGANTTTRICLSLSVSQVRKRSPFSCFFFFYFISYCSPYSPSRRLSY